MSIIYDALKKLEDSKKNKNSTDKKNTNLLKVFLLISLLGMGGLGLFFFQKYFKSLRKVKFKIIKTNKRKDFKIPFIKIEGILYQEKNPLVLYKGKIFKEGDVIKGAKIIKINENEVIFEYKGKEFKILVE